MRLEHDYLSHTKINIQKKGNLISINCEGPERLFEHGEWNWRGPSDAMTGDLISDPKIIAQLHTGRKVSLSKKEAERLELHKYWSRQVVRNISYELSAAQILNTTFLTNKRVHIEFLRSISVDPDIEERNAIAEKYLTSFVPFVNDVEIENLVKLRNREPEAFIQYRRALNEAIDEFRSQDKDFSERDARAIYSDIIAPQLTSLEQKVKHAKKDLVTKAYRSIVAVTGAITFGLYTGFIPAELAEMAKVLGFTKIATDILEKILPLQDARDSIKAEEMYFLWQVKKKEKK